MIIVPNHLLLLHWLVTCLTVTALGLGDASTNLLPAQGAPADPYVGTERYNTLPWMFKTGQAYVLGVSPISKPPTNPSAWSKALGRLKGFVGGPGMLIIFRYTDTPVGEYSELLYSPGGYKNSHCPSEKQLSSVQRIWVDSPYSQRAGRNIWGFPKEIATFDWQNSAAGAVTVTVKSTSGKTFFKATLSEAPLPQTYSTVASSIPQAFISNCMEVLQWPINDNTKNSSNAVFADTPVFKTCQAAAAERPVTPLKTPVCFDIKDVVVTKVDNAFMDAMAFTGRKLVTMDPGLFAYRLPAAANGTIGAPLPQKCWK